MSDDMTPDTGHSAHWACANNERNRPMTTKTVMQERWYVMEISGPYGWQVAQKTTEAYYDITKCFCQKGYKTEEEAKAEIHNYLRNAPYGGPFFVLKGLANDHHT